MNPSYNFPQDDYALTILTQAAMHTSSSSTSHSDYPRPASTTGKSDVSNGSVMNSITNQHLHQQHNRGTSNNVTLSRSPNILGDYNPAALSTRSMETLSYNPVQTGRQENSYLDPSPPYRGLGPQTSANYTDPLGILNAESYDDRGGAMRAQEAIQQRQKQQKEKIMPFGITDSNIGKMEIEPLVEEADGATRRRKKPRIESHSADEEEDARKKSRGRPRVDTKDETAADRRRTQIRMAQRAYRHRKETTISSLEKKVQDLRGTNEEMSNIFINLYDFAVGKGLLQREPEFGQQLQSTTERFLALAKSTAIDEENQDENPTEDSGNQNSVEPDTGRRPKGRKTSPKKQKNSHASTPPISEPLNPWGGYSVSKDDDSIEDIPLDYGQSGDGGRGRPGDLQIITRPTEENASFPWDFMDLQQYRVEVPSPPSISDFSQNFFPKVQPSLPKTYTYNEFSFARRIHRLTAERGLQFLTSEYPSQDNMQRIFGVCLMYETKNEIIQRLKKVVEASEKEPLHQWRQPFVHIGGAGTFYPMQDPEINSDGMPKFRTGLSMGPFGFPVAEAQEIMNSDLRCSLPGFEGDFFDANDVEGYLRGRGIDIPPTADFVTAELDLALLSDVPNPVSSASTVATVSPKTPHSPVDTILLNPGSELNYGLIQSKLTNMDNYALNFTDWPMDITMPAKSASNIDPVFHDLKGNRSETKSSMNNRTPSRKTLVTLNVSTLIEELISRCVCLGRSPGFRPADVNIAIKKALMI